MAKTAIIKLASIQYLGDSIGNDIRLEISILGRFYSLEKRIKAGETLVINQLIGEFEVPDNSLETEIVVKITEKDIIFSDSGQTTKKLNMQADSLPQKLEMEVKVRERRKSLRKATAVFMVGLEIETEGLKTKLRRYNIGPRGEDYNQYDRNIEKAVDFWNAEFNAQIPRPPVLLDPDLVKAIIYVESDAGYYRPKNGYSGYPDIMQVADPRNDAIYGLKNIFNPNRKKPGTEYEVIDGKLVALEYANANGNEPSGSIHWGVRWLYHLAQKNVKKNNSWVREWRGWKEAVYRYNRGGDKDYLKKVYDVYEKGVGDRSYELWRVVALILIVAGIIYGSLYTGLTVYDQLISQNDPAKQSKVSGAMVVEGKNAERFTRYEAATLMWERYPDTSCIAKADLFNNEHVLKNCTYTVGTNNGSMWTLKLASGEYHYTPKNHFSTARDETDGPSYVVFERSAQGDLNGDNLAEAVVVLRLNYGGTGNWLNMIVLVQENNGQYDQIANYMFDDREIVRGLLIDNGIIIVRVLTHGKGDGLCCPSVYDTYRFKILQ